MEFIDIENRKRLVLKELGMLDKLRALENYTVVDEYQELREGRFARWVALTPGQLKMTNGAVIVGSEMTENGLLVRLKSVKGEKYWSLRFNEMVLFQKMSQQELVLIDAIENSR
jgi:hypothetical protein